jgi:hypothetical protein
MPTKAGIQYAVTFSANQTGAEYWITRFCG